MNVLDLSLTLDIMRFQVKLRGFSIVVDRFSTRWFSHMNKINIDVDMSSLKTSYNTKDSSICG